MKRIWWLRGLKFALVAVAALALVGAVVTALWNWLMPGLFGWPVIGFWQALGLLLLTRIRPGAKPIVWNRAVGSTSSIPHANVDVQYVEGHVTTGRSDARLDR
jgi:hypothetical protein